MERGLKTWISNIIQSPMVYHGISWCITVFFPSFSQYIMTYHGVSLFSRLNLPFPDWTNSAFEKKNTEAPRNAALNSCADARRCLICLPGLPQGILESNYIVTTFQQQAYHGNHGIGP